MCFCANLAMRKRFRAARSLKYCLFNKLRESDPNSILHANSVGNPRVNSRDTQVTNILSTEEKSERECNLPPNEV